MLALFWETRWGRSAADCEAANAAQVQAGYAATLRRQVTRLRGIVTMMEEERAAGRIQPVNAPFYLFP